MRKFILPAALAAIVLPAPALAQDAAANAPAVDDAAMAEFTAKMRDPEAQRKMALMLRTMTEVMLDMPIAPIAKAAAEMAGETADDIDPDMTLRKMAPDSDRVGEEIEKNLPRAMDAMSSMAEAFGEMAPMMAEMADRMREALPEGE